MNDLPETCPKCGGAMEQGFIVDLGASQMTLRGRHASGHVVLRLNRSFTTRMSRQVHCQSARFAAPRAATSNRMHALSSPLYIKDGLACAR